MSYNSFIYLFVFLAVAWGAWAVLPQRGRPFVLLAASMVFYLVSWPGWTPCLPQPSQIWPPRPARR